jgi:hypothetical protein
MTGDGGGGSRRRRRRLGLGMSVVRGGGAVRLEGGGGGRAAGVCGRGWREGSGRLWIATHSSIQGEEGHAHALTCMP